MPTRPLRILVVDDDPAMVGAITALVGTEGHQVITAYDGLTAVKRFREEHPDLVLLDLAMPGPDGFNVAGQMRAVGQAPILIVSGESGEAAKVRALGLGADDYLTKPFGKAELLARITAIMRRVDRLDAGSGRRRAGRSSPETSSWSPAVTRLASESDRWRSRRPNSGCWRRWSGPAATSSRTSSWRGPAGRPRPIQTSCGSSRISRGCAERSRTRVGRRSWPCVGSGIGSMSGTSQQPGHRPRTRRRSARPDRGGAGRDAPQTVTAIARPRTSCAASAQTTRQPRASRPPSGLKWK